MNYIFDQLLHSIPLRQGKYDASNKPRMDIMRILEQDGYVPLTAYRRINIPKMTPLYILGYYIWMALRIKKDDTLCYQYPVMYGCFPYFLRLLSFLNNKGVRLVCIIHDLDYLRFKKSQEFKNRLIKGIKKADIVIAHTSTMKEYLEKEGVCSEIRVLYLFDYLSSDGMNNALYSKTHRNEVVFAGNLNKSKFIEKLNEYKFSYVKFVLYGIEPQFTFSEKITYSGRFLPDNVSAVKGGWGLVWDGESVETCSGMLGNYLRYNAPHKLSLYITCGIPVIVWRESGLAEWITKNKLGIIIDSLIELDGLLANIDDTTYELMQKNVCMFREKLRRGGMILDVLNT